MFLSIRILSSSFLALNLFMHSLNSFSFGTRFNDSTFFFQAEMFNEIICHLYEGIMFYENIRESGPSFFLFIIWCKIPLDKLSFKAK